MLGTVVIIAAIIFAGVVPVIVLVKYYSPKKRGIFANLFWIVVSVLTWPLVPIAMAVQHKDRVLLSIFWVSFLVFAIAGWYWGVLNVQTVITLQESLLKTNLLP